jgi:putative peptidoglycan lipid II flippase
MLAICGAAFGMGVLNSLGKFKASSFMPAFLNIIWIGALSALAFFPGASTASRIRFVSAAILVGGFAQMIFMFVCMKKAGVPIVPDFSGWRTDKVRLVWKNLGIAALGTGAVQVNCMLDQVLAQLASPWAAGVIGYAERLMDLPLGVVGVAFGTVLLPTFSGLFAHKDMEGAKSAFVASIRNQLLVMVPAGVGMALLAPDITKVVYEGGSFDGLATLRVSRSLSVYAAGLVLFSFQKAIVPWFQAQGDMKTPFAVSIVTVVVNALLNVAAVFLLPIEFRHVGLAVSTVLCSFLGCVILASKAVAKNGSFGFGTEKFRFLVICCAAAVMGVVVCALKRFLPEINAYFSLFVLVASGVAVYASLVLPLRKLWRAL